MTLLIEKNICDMQPILESIGYALNYNKNDDNNGIITRHYYKYVPTGRMHIVIESINALACRVGIHFDKYKGHQERVNKHATHYKHPYVKQTEKQLFEKLRESRNLSTC